MFYYVFERITMLSHQFLSVRFMTNFYDVIPMSRRVAYFLGVLITRKQWICEPGRYAVITYHDLLDATSCRASNACVDGITAALSVSSVRVGNDSLLT